MAQPTKKEEQQPLQKVLTRVGSLFRSKSKRASQSNIPTIATGESSATATVTTPAATTQPTRTPTQDPKQATAPATDPASAPKNPAPGGSHWSTAQQERARALFAKYGLTLEPHEWMSPRDLNVERVEKPIRMRVRRICHRCQTTYGPDKVCVNCQHVRCKKCARYPPARSKEEKEARAKAKAKGKAVEGATATAAVTAGATKKQKVPLLTIPSRTGGQDLVYKPIRQRVRRTCHRCQTLFQGDSKECSNCYHIRCKKCPRDPPKLHKYPDGYPGDADPPPERPQRIWRKPRMRVRYSCHVCQNLYVPGEKTCGQCGQVKGPDTIRDPPKKIKPELDPDIVRRVQERLAGLTVSHA